MTIKQVKNAAVVGSGTMGVGIAQIIVQNGFPAVLYDINEAQIFRAKQSIEKRLNRLVEKVRASKEEVEAAKKRLIVTTTLEDIHDVDLVIEAAPEKLEVKSSIFKQLESICSKETIFATNTSSLSVTEISVILQNPERLAGLHFFNPAPLMPLVEVVRGLHTSEKLINTLQEFALRVQKKPMFTTNRQNYEKCGWIQNGSI
ncbi:3-hydroxyacyl-CoA dehydrogenase family protein [Alteribacillus sp. JSM 102045]|uniref:3-hydroxyacyl-CoA dehydrogenase family protein n=1 Tax=Alteribacillus sp. JSM 102045 TaxID=1562101 RepID=UPI0035C1A269